MPIYIDVGGTSGQVQYNNDSSFAGAASASIDASGNLNILSQTLNSGYPPIPTSGMTLFVRNRAGKNMIGAIDNQGYDYTFQPHIGRNPLTYWGAVPGGTTITAFRAAALVTSGTAAASTIATTNFSSSLTRVNYNGAAATGNGGMVVGTPARFWRGNVADGGGFHFVGRSIMDWSTNTNTQVRMFMGMQPGILTLGNVNPSATLNTAGVCKNNANTTYQFVTNNATGPSVLTETGISCSNGDALEVQVWCKPNDTNIGISLQVLQSGTVATFLTGGNVIPVNTTLLSPMCWILNGPGTVAARLGFQSMYVITDN